jgi:hypothetical protein
MSADGGGGVRAGNSSSVAVSFASWRSRGYSPLGWSFATPMCRAVNRASSCQTGGFPLTWDTGNIDADPLFVNAAAYDFRLTAESPCGAGDPRAVPSDVTTDLAGNPRLADSGASVDMGPYQRAGSP